jgi:hypothetical protein
LATQGAYETQPPPEPQQLTQRKRTRLILLIAAVALLLLGTAIAIFVAASGSDKLTSAGAQRACRTAVEAEWTRRQRVADDGSTTVLASTQGIDLAETWETADGWKVNATVRYTLTTALVSPVQNTLNLTCTASGSDDEPVTSVANRS